MKLYWSTKQIPELAGLPITERMARLQEAEAKLKAPEKLMLNILKLLILVPIFVFILQASENWWALLWALLVSLAYPIVLKPLQYSVCAKHLSNKTGS